MGVLIDQLKVLSTHPNQFQNHAQASLRVLERRKRRGDTCKVELSADLASTLRGVHSEPLICAALDRVKPLKEVHSLPELGSTRCGTWPSEVQAKPTTGTPARRPSPTTLTGHRDVRLRCGAHQIPHPRKAETGGEDSFFVSPHGVGVADGVGEWEWRFRVNPRAFADELMAGAEASIERPDGDGNLPDAVQRRAAAALTESYAATRSWGSATALVACLDSAIGHLGIANLGDSGARHIRWVGQGVATIVGRTTEQQHSFNCPFQLARLPTPADFPQLLAEGKHTLVTAVQRSVNQKQDQPGDAALYSFPVQEGDLIVIGTDGVFDNLHDSEICALVEIAAGPQPEEASGRADPGDIAAAIAQAAFERSADETAKTPFGKHARDAGLHHVGGKMDDITVVVAWIVKQQN